MDREKVIKALSICVPETQDDANLECSDCPYGDVCNPSDIVGITLPLIWDIRELLKEQEDLGTELTNAVELIRKKNERIEKLEKLLKEQEKAKVVFGRCKDGSFATECGHCGMYLDKAYSICPKCNKELDWNSNQD